MYRILIHWLRGPDERGDTTNGSMPTIYLDAQQLGIIDAAHAEHIATAMLRQLYGENCGCTGPLTLYISAIWVPIKELGE